MCISTTVNDPIKSTQPLNTVIILLGFLSIRAIQVMYVYYYLNTENTLAILPTALILFLMTSLLSDIDAASATQNKTISL
jgi:hypothetical protein